MPRIVDREERRREIADAVFRVIGQEGMDAVSLRDVATEAGLSMGSIQHYFRTKDEMLLFALQHLRERVLRRFAAELAKLRNPSTKQYLRTVLRMLLPTNADSRQEAIVNISFFASSVNNEHFTELLHEGYTNLLKATQAQLRHADESGELRDGVDVATEAALIFYEAQGLIGPILLGVITARQAMRLLDAHLDRIFVGD